MTFYKETVLISFPPPCLWPPSGRFLCWPQGNRFLVTEIEQNGFQSVQHLLVSQNQEQLSGCCKGLENQQVTRDLHLDKEGFGRQEGVILIWLCRWVCERILSPRSLLCTVWFVHILQQNLQRKCQHLSFWLHSISHCKPLLPFSSHLPELKSRPLTYSRLPQNKYSGRFLPKSVGDWSWGKEEFASCNANSPLGFSEVVSLFLD